MGFEEPPVVRQRRFDESGMEILGEKTCLRLLHDQSLGRVAFIDVTGDPVALPVTYRLRRGRIYFFSSEGAKLRAATRGARVCFEVDGWNPATGDGWSVLVKGVCRAVDEREVDPEIGIKPWLRTALRPMKLVEIVPEEITGRRLPSSPVAPDWD
ncbi:MAG TPA: pyridoxamine 5'-phosphate oxidase family protein [Acidimicrobiia bacterium]|jgi:nitroimidazol reductase NimA-like FMN-containing flavoprotein (pyridoxamine 5'-phosphate oxidase superfamily)